MRQGVAEVAGTVPDGLGVGVAGAEVVGATVGRGVTVRCGVAVRCGDAAGDGLWYGVRRGEGRGVCEGAGLGEPLCCPAAGVSPAAFGAGGLTHR